MNWTILNNSFAYKKQKELLSIATRINLSPSGPSVEVDDDEITHFMIIDNESIYVKDWLDLWQFNNSNNLICQIQGINKALGNKELDLDEALQKDCVLNLLDIDYNEEKSEIEGALIYKGEKYSLKNCFAKYCFIDQKLVNNSVWDIKELFLFTVQLQVLLFRAEKELCSDPMFLSVDKKIKEKLLK